MSEHVYRYREYTRIRADQPIRIEYAQIRVSRERTLSYSCRIFFVFFSKSDTAKKKYAKKYNKIQTKYTAIHHNTCIGGKKEPPRGEKRTTPLWANPARQPDAVAHLPSTHIKSRGPSCTSEQSRRGGSDPPRRDTTGRARSGG